MRDKLTKIVAFSVALVMLVSGVALGIAGHATNNVSFRGNILSINLTTVPYHKTQINAARHLDSHLDSIQGNDNGFREELGAASYLNVDCVAAKVMCFQHVFL
jgi:hypothetical protein